MLPELQLITLRQGINQETSGHDASLLVAAPLCYSFIRVMGSIPRVDMPSLPRSRILKSEKKKNKVQKPHWEHKPASISFIYCGGHGRAASCHDALGWPLHINLVLAVIYHGYGGSAAGFLLNARGRAKIYLHPSRSGIFFVRLESLMYTGILGSEFSLFDRPS